MQKRVLGLVPRKKAPAISYNVIKGDKLQLHISTTVFNLDKILSLCNLKSIFNLLKEL
jgi:hypothetical protein